MGEIAEDIIEGRVCSLCGCFFAENGELYTHQYPAVCWDCWDELKPSERKHHQRAEVETL
jgi:hypothetical protein